MAEVIAQSLINDKEYIEEGETYVVDVYNPLNGANSVVVRLIDSSSCAYDVKTDVILIGKKLLDGDEGYLASLIYHELGHFTNVAKAGTPNVVNKDFETPMFLNLNDDEYKQIAKDIYLFQSRELKARCFETTMYLKKINKPISIQEFYNLRCTGLAKMKSFINRLKQIVAKGENSNEAYIIKGIYQSMSRMRTKLLGRDGWNFKVKTVLNYFIKQYRWLKVRVDKIYYDYYYNNN
jgi:hypothetical protein